MAVKKKSPRKCQANSMGVIDLDETEKEMDNLIGGKHVYMHIYMYAYHMYIQRIIHIQCRI